jgi:hypothetical protein
MSGFEPLPGSIGLAKRIERRRFLRKAATGVFYGLVAASSGTAGLLTILAGPAAAAAGPCCPNICCGPSPCCDTACCNKNCCAGANNATCVQNAKCLGFDKRHWDDACWSCPGPTTTTTCCDCRTNNETGCPNSSGPNRCICDRTIQNPPLVGQRQRNLVGASAR